jgi:hypothetical protein
MRNFGSIQQRWDDSYVINSGLYHVPDEGEFADLWQEVHAYALANPSNVTLIAKPEPPQPTPEELAARRRAEILVRLAKIDAASVRPLRAIAQGEDVQADHDKLAALDAEAAELRADLAARFSPLPGNALED